jgi:hypothetical protein
VPKPREIVATSFEVKLDKTVTTGFEAKPAKTVATGFEAKLVKPVTAGFKAKPSETVRVVLSPKHSQTIDLGFKARLWTSSWLKGTSPTSMFPALYKHSKRKNRTVAKAMTNDNWIRDLMHNITPELVTQYVLLWELIAAAGFNHQDQEADDIVWTCIIWDVLGKISILYAI